MRIAFVGSRLGSPHNQAIFDATLTEFPGFTLVSGGARGVDARSEFLAKQAGLRTIIHTAQWNRRHKHQRSCYEQEVTDLVISKVETPHGVKVSTTVKYKHCRFDRNPTRRRGGLGYWKAAGYERNRLIVRDADLVIAMLDKFSKGTRHTVHLAIQAGVPVRIYDRVTGKRLKDCPCLDDDTAHRPPKADEQLVLMPYFAAQEFQPRSGLEGYDQGDGFSSIAGEAAIFGQYQDRFGRTQHPFVSKDDAGNRIEAMRQLGTFRVVRETNLTEDALALEFEQTCGACGKRSDGGTCESCVRDLERQAARVRGQMVADPFNSAGVAPGKAAPYLATPRVHQAPDSSHAIGGCCIWKPEHGYGPTKPYDKTTGLCWCGYSHLVFNPRSGLTVRKMKPEHARYRALISEMERDAVHAGQAQYIPPRRNGWFGTPWSTPPKVVHVQ